MNNKKSVNKGGNNGDVVIICTKATPQSLYISQVALEIGTENCIKCPLLLSDMNQNCNLSANFSETSPDIKFDESRRFCNSNMWTDRQTDIHDEINRRIFVSSRCGVRQRGQLTQISEHHTVSGLRPALNSQFVQICPKCPMFRTVKGDHVRLCVANFRHQL